MGNNSKKHEGFTLLEVIISIALIAIISVGVYHGYLLLIRQTKEGQVKQIAALEGKQVIEEIKATIDSNDFTVGQNNLKVGNINFMNSNGSFIRYLDENYKDVDASAYKYIEKITLYKTKVRIGNTNNIDFKPAGGLGVGELVSNAGTLDYKISIKKNDSGIEIERNHNDDSDINDVGTNPVTISLDAEENLSLFVLASFDSSKNQKEIDIKDINGNIILKRIFQHIQNIDVKKQMKFTVNLEDDTLQNNSNGNLSNIQIDVYNKDSESLNVFLEKSSDLDVEVENHQGQVNIYDNGSEEKTKIGDLYDIRVEVDDRDGNNLFTGYSNENIDVSNN